MVLRRSPFIGSCVLLGVLVYPRPSGATDAAAAQTDQNPPKRVIPYRALEVQGVAMTQLLPRAAFGIDGAFVLGTPAFQVKLGTMVVGAPAFGLGEGKIANVLAVGSLDLCAAKNVEAHQIRMCIGGQGGLMAHRWIGYERPGRKATPWAAGTLKGDYRLALTERFGVMGGVGVVVPVVGPSFRAYDRNGVPSPLVFPGPVAGFVSLGTSYRW